MEGPRAGRVVVGVSSSLGGYQALRYALEQARMRGMSLIAVRTYQVTTTGIDIRDSAIAEARDEIAAALVGAFGVMPRDVSIRMEVSDGSPGRALATIAYRPTDLIVVGASHRHRFAFGRRNRVARVLCRKAACPVVIVPPPEMARWTSTRRLARNTAFEAEVIVRDAEAALAREGLAKPNL